MILKTLEFIPSDITYTLKSLQTDLTAGKYDDILVNFCFLTFTEKGLTLVKQDKTIVPNATIDLSEYITSNDIANKYVTKKEGYSLISDTEIIRLSKIDNYDDTDIKESIKLCALKNEIPDVSNFITSIPDEYITEEKLTDKGYLTEHQSLDEYAKKSDIPTFVFNENGILSVTINNVTYQYAPISAT